MKTSILISSFAALCLLVTFAEAPRRHGELKVNTASEENITIPMVMSAVILPGVFITADRKMKSGINPANIEIFDFGYLKFDVSEYLKADALYHIEAEVLPEASVTDYIYLKFDVNNYIKFSESYVGELPVLSVNETNSIELPLKAPALIECEYLRFDINKYMNNNYTENEGLGELPLNKVEPIDLVGTTRLP